MLIRIVHEVAEGRIFKQLPRDSRELVKDVPMPVLREEAQQIMTRPQASYIFPAHRFLMNLCLAAQWLGVFDDLDLPSDLHLYEPCVGSSEPVILAAEAYTDGHAHYTAVNLNRKLAAELKEKTASYRSDIRIIEDTALHAGAYIRPASLDAACFHHAINDILQTAVSEPRGMDTRNINWWDSERQMIEWLAEDADAGRLDEHARPALLEAVRQAMSLVKPGGYLLFDHWTFQAHREQSWFPWTLFCNLLPMARAWIREADLGLMEIPLPGKDTQWWMCLRVPEPGHR